MAEPAHRDGVTQRDSVAVVIVTYNRADVLVGCLDGLAAQTSPPDAVFVVDNASSDHTPDVLAARTDLPLRIIRIVEKSALRFDLTNPFSIHPKRASVDQRWHSRADMPAEVVLENVAFEGFMVHRRVIDTIGLPDPEYFIFYDDCDFAIRARRAGFTLVGVRDA